MKTLSRNWQIFGIILGAAAGFAAGVFLLGAQRAADDISVPILPYYSETWKNPKETAMLSLNFSPYYPDGADPELQSPVSEETIRSALDAVAPFTDTIRTFGVSGEMYKLYKIAKEEYGFRIIAGCWIGALYGEAEIADELEILAGLGNDNLADILVVGSEGLYRRDYGADSLIGWVNEVKGALTEYKPVGVSDTAGMLMKYPDLLRAVDVALFTYYPYFDGVDVKKAVTAFDKTYNSLRQVSPRTVFICSETGWKFFGDSVGRASVGPEEAAAYIEGILGYSRSAGLEVCIFEAVEEKWKMKYNDGGWGLLDENLAVRPAVKDLLARIAPESAAGDTPSAVK